MARIAAAALLLLGLAGCAGLGAPPEVPVAQESGSSPDLPGVTVAGFHNVTGDLHTLDLVARNSGTTTFYVYTSQSGAFSDAMRGPQGEVAIRNTAYTSICSWKAFAPGEVLRDEVAWDETLYQGQDAEGRDHPAKPAPPGRYAWTVRFTAWDEDTCPTPDDTAFVDVAFEVTV